MPDKLDLAAYFAVCAIQDFAWVVLLNVEDSFICTQLDQLTRRELLAASNFPAGALHRTLGAETNAGEIARSLFAEGGG